MSNELKWTDWRSTASDTPSARVGHGNHRSPWPAFLGCLAGLAALASVVPGPAVWPSALLGDPMGDRYGASSIGGAAESALLMTAGAVVWTLLGWGVVVGCVAVLGRLPGDPGRMSRAILGRIAPAAAGRLVAATIGVSLLAGTTACAAPAMAGSEVASTGPLSSVATATAADPSAPGSAQDAPSIDIDWPLATEPAAATPIPGQSPPPTTPTSAPTISAAPIDPEPTDPEVVDTVASASNETTEAPSGADPPSPLAATPSTGESAPPVSSPATEEIDGSGSSTSTTGTEDDAATSDIPDTPPTESGTTGASAPGGATTVTVRPGDSLWSIAAAALPATASPADIDSAWRAWYLTNRQEIGENPDVIRPGQTLLPPTTDLERSP